MDAARRALVAVACVALVAVPLWFGRDGELGPGLPAGFEVVDGSRQIGAAIPHWMTHVQGTGPMIDEGYEAILVVEGDPVEVMDEYVDQAGGLGLTDVPREVVCTDGGILLVFTCEVSARTPDRGEPRTLVLTFSRGSVGGSQPFSHLKLEYWTTPDHWDRAASRGPRSKGLEMNVPDRPESIDPPPRDRSMFDGWGEGIPVPVVDASRVAAELPGQQCTDWMPQALLEITGDPQEVLRDYIRQLSEEAEIHPSSISEPVEVEGGQLTEGDASALGGVSYDLALFESDEHGDWLRIMPCSD